MTGLAWAGLRSRASAFLDTLVAAFLAVALIGGAALLLFSVLTARPTTHRFDAVEVMVGGDRDVSLTTVTDKGKGKHKSKTKTERLAGAPVLPSEWAGKLAAIPGAGTVIADYSFTVALTIVDGAPIGSATGHGWASAGLMPFTVRTGTAPGAGELAVDPSLGLHPGDRVRAVTRTGARTLTVSGVVAQKLDEQTSVFVADSEVAIVSGLAGPTALGVRDASAAEVKQALGVDTVYTGADKVRADLPSALPDYIGAISIFGYVIGITTFATVFVLIGTVALAVCRRLRELALLRAVGATPRQLWRLLSAKTLFVSLIAAVAGAPAAVVVAQLIAARFRVLGAVPEQFTVDVNVAVLLAATAVTVLVAQLSARLAARRAIRIAPAQALQETVVEGRGGWLVRTLVALASTAGAAMILAIVPLDGPFGMGMTFISSALLLCAVGAAGPLLPTQLIVDEGQAETPCGVRDPARRYAGSRPRVQCRQLAGGRPGRERVRGSRQRLARGRR